MAQEEQAKAGAETRHSRAIEICGVSRRLEAEIEGLEVEISEAEEAETKETSKKVADLGATAMTVGQKARILSNQLAENVAGEYGRK